MPVRLMLIDLEWSDSDGGPLWSTSSLGLAATFVAFFATLPSFFLFFGWIYETLRLLLVSLASPLLSSSGRLCASSSGGEVTVFGLRPGGDFAPANWSLFVVAEDCTRSPTKLPINRCLPAVDFLFF